MIRASALNFFLFNLGQRYRNGFCRSQVAVVTKRRSYDMTKFIKYSSIYYIRKKLGFYIFPQSPLEGCDGVHCVSMAQILLRANFFWWKERDYAERTCRGQKSQNRKCQPLRKPWTDRDSTSPLVGSDCPPRPNASGQILIQGKII